MFSNDDIVRKAAQNEPLGTLSPRFSGHVGERNDLLFEQIQRSVKRLCEFDPQTWPLFFVPSSGFNGLVGGLFEGFVLEPLSRVKSFLEPSRQLIAINQRRGTRVDGA